MTHTNRWEHVMRIVQWPGPAAVVLRSRDGVTLAIPRHTPRDDILDLASVMLTTSEYQELRHAIAPQYPAGRGPAPSHHPR